MNHAPRQLALLISLIGAGVAPCAAASALQAAADARPAWPDPGCRTDLAGTAPVCAEAAETLGAPPRSPLDLRDGPALLVLFSTPSDPQTPLAAALDTDPAGSGSAVAALLASGWAADGMRDGDAAAPAAPAAPATPTATTPPTKDERVAATGVAPKKSRLRRMAAVPRHVVPAVDAVALPRIAPLTWMAPVRPAAVSDDAMREALAAVLIDQRPAETKLVPEVQVASAAPAAPAAPDPLAAGPDSATARVLRELDAIRTEPRRVVAAPTPEIAPEAPPAAPRPVSQSARVLATLEDVALGPAVQPIPTQDGSIKRLRKLEARVAKAQAQAAEALAAGVVDVMLPLTPPQLAKAAAGPLRRAGHLAQAAAASPFGDTQVAVAASSLDRVRGGFSGEGLNISFGIERAVYINGALVTSTTMNVTDLGQASAGRAQAVLDSGTVSLIQTGGGNSVAVGSISSSTAGSVVQNSVDGQKIQNMTVINATANSLGIYRSLNLGASLRGAVIDSLRR